MPRQIKRYENRKLYDTEGKTYVSLSGIAELVRQGEDVQVVDNTTGEDITAPTLTQIILEEGKQGQSVISTAVLHDLLRRSGEVVDAGVGQLRHTVDELVHTSMSRIGQFLRSPQTTELQQLRDQVGRLETLLSQMLAEHEAGGEAPSSGGAGNGVAGEEKPTSS